MWRVTFELICRQSEDTPGETCGASKFKLHSNMNIGFGSWSMPGYVASDMQRTICTICTLSKSGDKIADWLRRRSEEIREEILPDWSYTRAFQSPLGGQYAPMGCSSDGCQQTLGARFYRIAKYLGQESVSNSEILNWQSTAMSSAFLQQANSSSKLERLT